MLIYKSPAKINLTLEVLSRRQDGYHNISTIMQSINVFDLITYEPNQDVLVSSNIKGLDLETNLIFKAIKLLQNKFKVNHGVKINLNKNIPIASGLGGGSSNAATTLIALNTLWRLYLNPPTLISLAESLGSDVPFFISRGTALISGKGEIIEQLPDIKPILFLIIHNDNKFPNKTYSMYKSISPSEYTSGKLTHEFASRIKKSGNPQSIKLFNCFDKIAPRQFPEFNKYSKILQQLGLNEYHLAGSGPTIMIPIHTRLIGEKIKFALWDQYSITSTIIQSTSSQQNTYMI